MRRLLLLLSFILFSSAVFSQQGIFTFYSVDEGLSQSTVTCLFRDTFGYLWIGTGDGLSVFNGYEFRNFKSNFSDPAAMTNNTIRGIKSSADGKSVWVGTEGDVEIFSANAANHSKVELKVKSGGEEYLPVWFNDSCAWVVATSTGIYRCSLKTKKAVLQLSFDSPLTFAFNPLKTPGEFIYRNINKEICVYSVITGKLKVFPCDEAMKQLSITRMQEMNNGKVLLSTSDGFWEFDKESGTTSRFILENFPLDGKIKSIRTFDIDQEGKIWFAIKEDGLYVYDPVKKFVRPCNWEQNGVSVRSRLKNIQRILCDPYGVVWLGTDDEGLVRVITNRIFFKEEYLSPFVNDTCNWFMRAFYKNGEGKLFAGTFGEGLKVVDEKEKKVLQFNVGNSADAYTPGSVNCIVPAGENFLALGTDHGVVLFDTVNYKLIPVADEHQSYVNCFFRSRDGTIFAGTRQGAYVVEGNGNKRVLKLFAQKQYNISAITESSNGNLLIATRYGEIDLIDTGGEIIRSQTFSDIKPLPVTTLIHAFVTAANGNIWAASNLGLLEFSQELSLEKIYTDEDGLPQNMLYGLIRLPDNELLITTGKGISVFDPVKKTFSNYGQTDGMKSDECNMGALLLAADSSVYIGGVNGYDVIHFPFHVQQFLQPKILLGDQQFFDLALSDTGNYFFENKLSLKYFQNTFSFQLWQTDFAFSEYTNYNYRLNGFDPADVNAGNKRFIRYAEVKPGNYNFEVHIKYPGLYSPVGQNLLSVTIIPPYWETKWFAGIIIAALILLTSLGVYLFVTFRYRRELRKLQTQRELERIRIRISGDIHDDIGSGLTRIALTSDLLAMQLKGNETLNKKALHVSGSARELTESLKEVVWSVKPEYDNLYSMIRYFRTYCGEFLEDSPISLSFHAPEKESSIPVSPEMRRNLFLILKEALNNIVKHSGALNVTVSIAVERKNISMKITDDGKGFGSRENLKEQEEKMNSNGLRNMERRAKSVGLKFSFLPGKEKGTELIVTGELN